MALVPPPNYLPINDYIFAQDSPLEELIQLFEQQRLLPFIKIEEGNPLIPISASLEVRLINSTIGYGVFALADIPQGTFLGFYAGKLTKYPYEIPAGDYRYLYPIVSESGNWSIDAEPAGNITRFYNHSFKPNLTKKWISYQQLLYRCFFAQRVIQQGEELSCNYGSSYWLLRDPPLAL